METTVNPIGDASKRLNRLYREKEIYIEKANELRTQANQLRQGSAVGTGYEDLMNRYQDAISWVFGIEPEIDQAVKDLEKAVNSAGWV